MCILLVAYRAHPDYDLVVAANRDEFYTRASVSAAYWPEHPALLAGRDLQAGGTWLGVNTSGDFAAVTNLRGAFAPTPGYSRGHLVRDFLLRPDSSAHFLARLESDAHHYAGCNLILSDGVQLYCWSNEGTHVLQPGIYGISNTAFASPWPKVERLKAAFAPLRQLTGAALAEALLHALRDAPIGNPEGVPAPDFSRLEETIFVHTAGYGTRCSSVVLRSPRDQRVQFIERRYAADTDIEGEDRYSLAYLS